MEKAKKLPSGTWRIRAYDSDGKRVSFTGETKADAEQKAAEFLSKRHRRKTSNITVGEAIDGYIEAKENVLSPSTIRNYARMVGNYDPIKHKKLNKLTSEEVQRFVSDLSETKSPKTVKNIYALLTASMGLYAPDLSFKVTLPALQKKRPVSPSDEDVRALYMAAQPAVKVCIGFAMCGMREGEISALQYEDITDGIAHVHAVYVKDRRSQWIYKPHPKTGDSDRFIRLPQFLQDLIGEGEGFIVGMNPSTISKKFTVLRDKLGYNIRLHDLRHYFASTAAILGIPDVYTADMGGWGRGSSVMKTVYQNNITSMSDYYAKVMNSHLDKVVGKI